MKMNIKMLVVLAIALVGVSRGFSQTIVSGGIYFDTVWSAINSPFLVSEDVTVFPNVTLTIEPGVVVMFEEDRSLVIRGELLAVGTEQDSIVFTSSVTPGLMGSWHGITTGGVQPGIAELQYCSVLYASYGVNLTWGQAGHVPSSIQNCTFRNNFRGIFGYGSFTLPISDCSFSNNTYGTQTGQIQITNSIFFNNYKGVGGGSGSGFSTISNSIFCGNGTAIDKSGVVEHSLIKNNALGIQYGVSPSNTVIMQNGVGVRVLNEIGTGNVICDNDTNMMNVSANTIDASSNCWCSENETTIGNTIWDGYDDTQFGLINFLPIAPCIDWSIYDTLNCFSVSATYLLFNTMVDVPEEVSLSLNLYPNPASQNIRVEVSGSPQQPSTITITDMLGHTVLYYRSESQEQHIDISGLANGIYTLTATLLNQEVLHHRLVVQH